MSKSQIIIAISGIISVILLFTLPKVIVQDKRSLKEENHEKHDTSESHGPDMKKIHKVELSDNDRNIIENLRKSLLSVSIKEKKLIFADSLVKTYRKIHQYDSAAKYSELISSLEPSELNWAKTADVYVEAYNFSIDDQKQAFNEKAGEYYRKILEKSPKNLAIKSKLALTYIGSQTPMEGIKILREVLAEDPKNESAIYNLGILSIQSGQYDKAIKRFEELIKINPKNSGGQFYLGVSYMNAGDKANALDAFKKAKTLDKDPEFQATVDGYIKELQ